MKHVFVETNWVVDYVAPVYFQTAPAVKLAEQAARGGFQLHLPAVCLTEARHPVQTRVQPRSPADSVRRYLPRAIAEEKINEQDARIVRRLLDQYESGGYRKDCVNEFSDTKKG